MSEHATAPPPVFDLDNAHRITDIGHSSTPRIEHTPLIAYNSLMVRRLVITAISLLTAGLVLYFALTAEVPTGQQRRAKPSGYWGSNSPSALEGDGEEGIKHVKGAFLARRMKGGQLVEIHGAELNPLPDGIHDVIEPRAVVFLTNNRVVQITGDTARVNAPHNQIRGGVIRGSEQQVVLTMYQGEQGKAIDFSPGSPHVQWRVYLDEADFDLELGQITSDGLVFATGRKFEFQGRGLDMNYDTLNDQLRRMVIRKGDSLRLKREAKDDEAADDPPLVKADGGTKRRDGEEAKEPEPPLWYRVRCTDNIRINAPGVATRRGKVLTLLTAQGGQRSKLTENLSYHVDHALTPLRDRDAVLRSAPVDRSVQGRDGSATTGRTSSPWPPAVTGMAAVWLTGDRFALADAPGTNVDATASNDDTPVTPNLSSLVKRDPRSLAPLDERDILIRWEGPATIDPMEAAPPQVGDAGDAMLTLEPVHAVTQTTPEPDSPAAANDHKDVDAYTTKGAAKSDAAKKSDDKAAADQQPLRLIQGPDAYSKSSAPKDEAKVDIGIVPKLFPEDGEPFEDDEQTRDDADALPVPEGMGGSAASGSETARPDTGPSKDVKASTAKQGTPAETDDRALHAAKLDYFAASRQIRLYSSNAVPLHLSSRKLGILAAQPRHADEAQLVLHQDEGRGEWIGPGRMKTHGEPTIVEHLDRNALPASLPPGSKLTWHRRVDLAFYEAIDKGNDGDSGASRRGKAAVELDAIKSVTFSGDVEVRHMDFDLDAQSLALNLDRTGEAAQSLRKIEAEGKTRLRTRATTKQKPLDVTADRLDVSLVPGERRRIEPRRFTATGNVVAVLPREKLRAGRLDIELGWSEEESNTVTVPKTLDTATADSPFRIVSLDPLSPFADTYELPRDADDGDDQTKADEKGSAPRDGDAGDQEPRHGKDAPQPRLVVKKLEAVENVTIELVDSKTKVTGHRLIASPDDEQVDIHGSETDMAVVNRPDGVLKGFHIVLRRSDQSVFVQGPGELRIDDVQAIDVAILDPADDQALNKAEGSQSAGEKAIAKADNGSNSATKEDDRKDSRPSRPTTTVFTTWTDSLNFNNGRGIAHFTGDVHFRTAGTLERTQLKAGHLMLEFTPATQWATEAVATIQETQPVKLGTRDRKVRRIIARRMNGDKADARFVHVKWADKEDGKVIKRFQLTGPELLFDYGDQQIRVDDAGTMLWQDLVAKSDDETDGKAATSNTANDKTAKREPPSPRRPDDPLAAVKGPGDTLFQWKGRLVMDALNNDVLIREQVRMLHQPLGSNEVVQLDCQRLDADLKATGGIDRWLGKNPPNPQLVAVSAQGTGTSRVFVFAGRREFAADVMRFNALQREATFDARKGEYVRMNYNDVNPVAARRIIWDMAEDKVRLIDPAAVNAPRR